MRYLLISAAVAVAYCYYNWQFFKYESELLGSKKVKGLYIQLTFLINYGVFMLMSYLRIHLCVNWTFFLIALLAENLVIFRCSVKCAYSLALTGSSMGLALNILFRCMFAIGLKKPLAIFDNNVETAGNMKRYPVFLGFLIAGIVFYLIRKKGIAAKLKIIMEEPVSLRFLCSLQSILYIYLILNLLGYYTEGNSFPMKVWGIKSALFSTLGMVLLIIYVVYMNKSLSYQREVMMRREELLAAKKDEEKVWLIAFTDTLTGCYNRQYAQEVFRSLEETETEVVLCFVDLDGLKKVNDNYGHQKGDSYLLTVVSSIMKAIRKEQDYVFRYGGDEFLLLFKDITPETVEFRMRKVQQRLDEMSNTYDMPFNLSISFGTASRSEAKNLKETVDLADKRMYERKQKKKGDL